MSVIHQGKVKVVLSDPGSQDRVIIRFTDTVTAGDGAKREVMPGKGALACDTTVFIFQYLAAKGIDTHLISRYDEVSMLCHRVTIYPVEVVCRNIAAGSFCRRYGIERGRRLSEPLVEFFLKRDDLHDPLIAPDAIVSLGLATEEELGFMRSVTLSVNHYLSELFSLAGLVLVDFKLEFGKSSDGRILLADEITGDSIRVWDESSSSLDKDLFREDKGDLMSAYRQLFERIRRVDSSRIELRKEKVCVLVMSHPGIKNPPGEVAMRALKRLGLSEIREVRAGKIYELSLERPINSEMLNRIRQLNLKLLSNPIVERTRLRVGQCL
ncbi:MAG: phosphoribosylaminoimidazolesuccinocarboxamide synthase [Candidatus Thorarchaeota archaeon]